ncbi:MAG: 4-hydroxythreonine-4-phosphate dehydrogenase, partial [Roseiarcus sp.]
MHAAPIAMTMGDPAGIGPELLLRAWLARDAIAAPFFALADPDALAELARRLALAVPIAVVDPSE